MTTEVERGLVIKKLTKKELLSSEESTILLLKLSQGQHEYGGSTEWETLAGLVANNTKIGEERFVKYARSILKEINAHVENDLNDMVAQNGNLARTWKNVLISDTIPAAGGSVISLLGRLPTERKLVLVAKLTSIMEGSLNLPPASINAISSLKSCLRTSVLASTVLTSQAAYAIYCWMKGEITGLAAVKIVTDLAAGIAGGVGGAALGAGIGGSVGPVGAGVGLVVGAIVVGVGAEALCSKLTSAIFNLPPDVALSNAYKELGLNHNATTDDINAAFKKALLRTHPDRGGKQEDFMLINTYMEMIKSTRR